MTQDELLEKIGKFIQTLDNEEDHEWWVTDHEVGTTVLRGFIHWAFPELPDTRPDYGRFPN